MRQPLPIIDAAAAITSATFVVETKRYRKADAVAACGTLSDPSKMPGKSTGFSPEHCITGSKLREVPDSVCFDCYACKGCYQFPSVKTAHDDRFAKLQTALHGTPEDRERWIRGMTFMVQGIRSSAHFRWHDAGDVQSVEHLQMIAEVCRRTPKVSHWLPTREYGIVADYLETETRPDNLLIRESAHMVNRTIPTRALPEGVVASAVFTNLETAPGFHCGAYTRDGECGPCRACWSADVPLVVYPKH